jgi:hypothetical protein
VTKEKMEMSFEILDGLPTTGHIHNSFSHSGKGTHSEGLVVRFYPEGKKEWVGNFISGIGGWDGAVEIPWNQCVAVVSSGEGYIVDPSEKKLIYTFGGMITGIIDDKNLKGIVLIDLIRLWILKPGDTEFKKTERISWDGLQNVHLDGRIIKGEAYTELGKENGFTTFAYDLDKERLIEGCTIPV